MLVKVPLCLWLMFTYQWFAFYRYSPPVIPDGFKPYHKFLAPLEIGNKHSGPPPPEVPPPEENNLRVLIEGFATLVARCGRLFEDLSKEKNKQNHMFAFLDGGKGHDYYARKMWEEQQKRHDETKRPVDIKSNVEKMTAEGRGRILGERPLERSSQDSSSSVVADAVQLQFNLSDTFMKPGSIVSSFIYAHLSPFPPIHIVFNLQLFSMWFHRLFTLSFGPILWTDHSNFSCDCKE